MHLFRQNAPANADLALSQIPVIDFGPYFAGEPGALDRLGEQVRDACERIGFFYVQNHGVSNVLIDQAFEQSRRFHALPLEEKRKLKLDQYNVGYLEMNASTHRHSTVHKVTKPNQNESFFVTHDRPPDHPDRVADKPLRGGNYWPDDLPGFRDGVMAYFEALRALGDRMLPAFAVALDLDPAYFAPLFSDENHATLRMLHYPPTVLEENDFGTGPHTDNSFLTILARSEVPGLAVRLPSDEWIEPPLIPGTFLVNIGNIIRRMSNDRFLSTPHGVIVEGEKDRYSLAYYHSPNPYRTIEVVPSCVDDQNPPKYEPALYADLIMEFFSANYFHQKNYDNVDIRNTYK
ncbi:MAG: 2-oxoglutarate and iron-dependent oxygenase domain-containing protein [Pseudomonadota bacterium]